MANYALRIPDSLMVYARQVALEEQISINQFFATAIAEKVSALKTEAWFADNGKLEAIDLYMAKVAPVSGLG